MKEIPFSVKLPIVCMLAALIIALGANIGVWYGKSKRPVVVEEVIEGPVEVSEQMPPKGPLPNIDEAPGITEEPVYVLPGSEEARELPWEEQPLEASWYEIYANIMEDPTGYKRGVDYTPVIPYIERAMKKGYLVNADWKTLKVEINIAEAIPEKKRIDEAMKKARKKMREALE